MTSFSRWLDLAPAGSEFEYARSDMAVTGRTKRMPADAATMGAARTAFDGGLVLLVQRRVGVPEEGVIAYIAVRRAGGKARAA